jgi:lipopolysaccharide transport system permease protein
MRPDVDQPSQTLANGAPRVTSPSISTRPEVVIGPARVWSRDELTELWSYRELLYLLVWRDVKVRYKQTVFGAGWAILQPLLTMVVFTVIFGGFAKIDAPGGLPYPIFSFAALLPWGYFSQAITRSSASLVGNANLVSKVYFPRLIIPIAAALAPAVDFAVASIVLVAMMIWYGIAPTWGALLLPAFLILAFLTALSVGLWLTALNVKYRDVGHTIPFLVQIWLYASPVAYPVSLVPEKWRLLYSLNPMVGVIEGFRWGLLGRTAPEFGLMAVSLGAVIVLLVGGVLYFRSTERVFADVI